MTEQQPQKSVLHIMFAAPGYAQFMLQEEGIVTPQQILGAARYLELIAKRSILKELEEAEVKASILKPDNNDIDTLIQGKN